MSTWVENDVGNGSQDSEKQIKKHVSINFIAGVINKHNWFVPGVNLMDLKMYF